MEKGSEDIIDNDYKLEGQKTDGDGREDVEKEDSV